MSNQEKYDHAFIESFSLPGPGVDPGLEYNTIAEWDSIGHMSLVATLEDAFGVAIETDDIVTFGSYAKGIEILKKYGVEI